MLDLAAGACERLFAVQAAAIAAQPGAQVES
jgi:hypothetical protein